MEFRIGFLFCYSEMNNLPTPFLIKFILSFSLVQFSYLNTTLISERYQVSFLLEHQSLHSIFNFSVMIIIWKERYIPALLTFYCVTHALNPAWLADFLLVGLFYCILPSTQNLLNCFKFFIYMEVTVWKIKSGSHRNLGERTKKLLFDLWVSCFKIF